MPFQKIAFVQIEEFNEKNFSIAKCISSKLNAQLFIFLLQIEADILPKIEEELKKENINYQIKSFDEIKSLKSHIQQESPDIVILTEEKINPLKHIFTHTHAEKLLKHVENFNIILLQENEDNIQKALVYVNKEVSEFYIKTAYEFVKKVVGEVTFVYSFYEDFYEVTIRKTHTEEEAEEILSAMIEEKEKEIVRKIENAIENQPYHLITILGEPKKEINIFAIERSFNFVIVSSNVKDKTAYIENLQVSLGIFLDKKEVE